MLMHLPKRFNLTGVNYFPTCSGWAGIRLLPRIFFRKHWSESGSGLKHIMIKINFHHGCFLFCPLDRTKVVNQHCFSLRRFYSRMVIIGRCQSGFINLGCFIVHAALDSGKIISVLQSWWYCHPLMGKKFMCWIISWWITLWQARRHVIQSRTVRFNPP